MLVLLHFLNYVAHIWGSIQWHNAISKASQNPTSGSEVLLCREAKAALHVFFSQIIQRSYAIDKLCFICVFLVVDVLFILSHHKPYFRDRFLDIQISKGVHSIINSASLSY
jgi:hypothetical protein